MEDQRVCGKPKSRGPHDAEHHRIPNTASVGYWKTLRHFVYIRNRPQRRFFRAVKWLEMPGVPGFENDAESRLTKVRNTQATVK